MKILLICPTSNQIITFRKSLIEKLQSEDFQVYTIAFDEEKRDIIESRNIKLYCVGGSNRSLNPFKILTLKNNYKNIIKQVQPDIVFTFMLKPNLFGVQAAKEIGIKKIFSMVEGAGDVFINNGLKWKIIRAFVCKMYRKSFKSAQKVFFLNKDDKAEFVNRKLVKEEQSEIIAGIGVDTDYFSYKPLKKYRTFLMIARMLKTKGVLEYCKAARIVKQKYPDAIFNYLGAEGNIKITDIQEYIDDGSINYLGTTKDVRPYLEDCSVFVLPSYREGMPVSIMEAESVGRPIITSDVPGCRECVQNDYNGFLFKCGDINILVEKIKYFIKNPYKINEYGKLSRNLAVTYFDFKNINEGILKTIME